MTGVSTGAKRPSRRTEMKDIREKSGSREVIIIIDLVS